jgi:hypothetical protein
MPEINIDELVCDLKDYLPSENELSDNQLESLATNIVENKIKENDEEYYAEALCKSLKVAAIMNHMNHTISDSALKREQIGKVHYEYSEDNQKNKWKEFERSLPKLCPYLPKGGYSIPTAIGILVKKGDEVKITSCDDTDNLIL